MAWEFDGPPMAFAKSPEDYFMSDEERRRKASGRVVSGSDSPAVNLDDNIEIAAKVVATIRNQIETLVSETARLRAELENRWLPMETAPKDGTPIIVAYDATGDVLVVYFCSEIGHWREWAGNPCYRHYPTHWMPIPPPPGGIAKAALSAEDDALAEGGEG